MPLFFQHGKALKTHLDDRGKLKLSMETSLMKVFAVRRSQPRQTCHTYFITTCMNEKWWINLLKNVVIRPKPLLSIHWELLYNDQLQGSIVLLILITFLRLQSFILYYLILYYTIFHSSHSLSLDSNVFKDKKCVLGST